MKKDDGRATQRQDYKSEVVFLTKQIQEMKGLIEKLGSETARYKRDYLILEEKYRKLKLGIITD